MFWPVRRFDFDNQLDDFFDVWDVAFPTLGELTHGHHRRPIPHDEMFRVKLDVGHYKPDEVKVELKDGKAIVTGKHESQSGSGGFDLTEFKREYQLPCDCLIDTFKHYITGSGILVLEAKKKNPEIRHSFKNDSTKDLFKVTFDVEGYKQDEVSVSLHGTELMVLGKTHSSSTKDGKSEQQEKSFRRNITLSRDVVLETLKPVWTADGYLIVEAKRDSGRALEGAKVLAIQHQ